MTTCPLTFGTLSCQLGKVEPYAPCSLRMLAASPPGPPSPSGRRHGWKFIRFGPDGALYIPIGANCNGGREPWAGQAAAETACICHAACRCYPPLTARLTARRLLPTPAACRLDGTPPNNGYIDGKPIYNAANSGNVSHVTAPFT